MAPSQDTILISQFADELRVEGINCKGYGIIPKYAMMDSELTIQAKAIYAYFCSYSGAGSSSFPSRDRILADLGIGKAAYYTHYNLLIENGYLTVEQNRTGSSRFYHNIYTLQSCPAKFRGGTAEEYLRRTYAMISAGGLKSVGFGFIPRTLMIDRRLSHKAKALYAYYSSFLGAGESAFPEKKDTVSHLGISPHTYEKLNRELLSLNYITVRQRHVNGRLGVNDVFLVEKPDESLAASKHLIAKYERYADGGKAVTAVSGGRSAQKQNAKNQDTAGADCVLQSAKNQNTVKQDTEKQNTRNQPVISNSSQKQQPSKKNNSDKTQKKSCVALFRERKTQYNRALGREADLKKYTPRQKTLQDQALEGLFSEKTLPFAWHSDRLLLKAAVEVLTDDEGFGSKKLYAQVPNGEQSWSTYCLYRDSLINMLTATTKMNLGGNRVSAEEVYEKLLATLEIDEKSCELSLGNLYDRVSGTFQNALHTTVIKNPSGYMKSCIWNAMISGELGTF